MKCRLLYYLEKWNNVPLFYNYLLLVVLYYFSNIW